MSGNIPLQIVGAAAGWRTVNALLGFSGDLDTAGDDELLWFEPIACFALVENEERERHVKHVVPQDWPQYLWIETDDHPHLMGYLAPGESVTDDHREEARRMIAEHHAKDADSQERSA